MSVLLASEKGNYLDLAETEALFSSFYRASASVTISAGGAMTIPGSGRYKVLPNSGVADDLTSIVLTAENIEGTLIQLRPQTVGHTITIPHAGTIHLLNGQTIALTTIYSTIWLRHHGGGIWAAESLLAYVP